MSLQKLTPPTLDASEPAPPVVPPAPAPELEILEGERLSGQDPLEQLQPQPMPKRKRRWYHITLVELLVMSTVLGVLGFMALPSFMNCGTKARQAEGKATVGSLNRAQQAHFLERGTFAPSLAALELGIKPETLYYQFSVRTTPQAAFSYAVVQQSAAKTARSYVGAVFLLPVVGAKQPETVAIMCEALNPGPAKLAEPTLKNTSPTCASGTRDIARR